MGANEKYEATYHGGEYGEILDSSRLNYALSKDPGNGRTTEEWWAVKDEAFKEFDRAIAKVRAEAKAEALTDLVNTSLETRKISKFQAAWIRGLAREYTQGPHKIVGAFTTPETNKENKK
ncbi:hypothetical protein [Glutamicibacter sp. BW77]|uniref:hypothetical protein n=1 Tax=Glutamicibacter sp. BW77 TaxID=2024402 RepID=UPI000BB68227|nr:hypothetical protein [Glutamicibacter sp. BW77]PCC31414.1 hypothetical protein CIK74_17215 [Glutamicibacter sp. BW77]